MKLTIDYNHSNRIAIVTTNDIQDYSWQSFCRFIRDKSNKSTIDGYSVCLPWNDFLSIKANIASIVKNICHADLHLTDAATKQLTVMAQKGYYNSIKHMPIDESELEDKLDKVGFQRKLTTEQKRNVCKLASLPAGATFSVPGAGKTTEALAYYFCNARHNEPLLIVAPKNAFGAWDEQLNDCLGDTSNSFVRLTGGEAAIKAKLAETPQFAIMTYQQFPRVRDLLYEYLMGHDVFMFLDESHRIKGGTQGIIADSIITAAHLPTQKLIMSGTPMPQSEADLTPQLAFLYPDLYLGDKNSADLIQPIYVRTTKAELNLPQPIIKRIPLQLMPKQAVFYQLLKSETARQVCKIPRSSRYYMRQLGRSIIKLMQFTSNPALLARDIDMMFSHDLSELLLDEESVKVEYACRRARELSANNEKVIIWTSFVANVELIARRLSDIGSDYIHGGVDAGSDEDADTREGKIKRFHKNENAHVLVANPAAASEGISLHKVCHTAIYVDRSFNAAQYLQSVDRIHRLGLPNGVDTNIEILECINTVDMTIRSRLIEKINRMAEVLNDKSLAIESDPYAFENDIDAGGIDESDIQAILQHLGGEIND